MSFSDQQWEKLLPSYLRAEGKDRLKDEIKQFFGEHRIGDKKYDNFYHSNPPLFFLQGDLINSILSPDWDEENRNYQTKYTPAILISSTCDICDENDQSIPKKTLCAPVVPVELFLKALKEDLKYNDDKIKSMYATLKNQMYSNIFYLPPNEINKKDYLVFLDNIFPSPPSELKIKLTNLKKHRFISLNHFGFYLFITKLSYHLCRAPEEKDR